MRTPFSLYLCRAETDDAGGLQPDLPLRLAKNLPLAKGDRETYYTQGTEGYIDYPFAEEDFARLFSCCRDSD